MGKDKTDITMIRERVAHMPRSLVILLTLMGGYGGTKIVPSIPLLGDLFSGDSHHISDIMEQQIAFVKDIAEIKAAQNTLPSLEQIRLLLEPLARDVADNKELLAVLKDRSDRGR